MAQLPPQFHPAMAMFMRRNWRNFALGGLVATVVVAAALPAIWNRYSWNAELANNGRPVLANVLRVDREVRGPDTLYVQINGLVDVPVYEITGHWFTTYSHDNKGRDITVLYSPDVPIVRLPDALNIGTFPQIGAAFMVALPLILLAWGKHLRAETNAWMQADWVLGEVHWRVVNPGSFRLSKYHVTITALDSAATFATNGRPTWNEPVEAWLLITENTVAVPVDGRKPRRFAHTTKGV